MYFIAFALLLLVAYGAVLVVEARRGARFFAPYREALDRAASQARFVVLHIDFASFAREESARAARYLMHESAHLALQAVRAIERFLTRIVK
ncbi:MAG: hypothetical protein KGH97_02995, partial [Patescibacteria group bacterium]|nr:hypothetical protein [Patescibacteria group bacterium]